MGKWKDVKEEKSSAQETAASMQALEKILEKPLDLLVKNLLDVSEEAFTRIVTRSPEFLTLCNDAIANAKDDPKTPPLLDLFLHFYHAHGTLDEVFVWAVCAFYGQNRAHREDKETLSCLDWDETTAFALAVLRMGEGKKFVESAVTCAAEKCNAVISEEGSDDDAVSAIVDCLFQQAFRRTKQPSLYVKCCNLINNYLRTNPLEDGGKFPANVLFINLLWCTSLNNVRSFNGIVSERVVKLFARAANIVLRLACKECKGGVVTAGGEADDLLIDSKAWADKMSKFLSGFDYSKQMRSASDADGATSAPAGDVDRDDGPPSRLTSTQVSDVAATSEALTISSSDVARSSTDQAYTALRQELTRMQMQIDLALSPASPLYARFYAPFLKYLVDFESASGWKTLSEDAVNLVNAKTFAVTDTKQMCAGLLHHFSEPLSKKYGDQVLVMTASRYVDAPACYAYEFLHNEASVPLTEPAVVEARELVRFNSSRSFTYTYSKMPYPLHKREMFMVNHDLISPDRTEAMLCGHSIEADFVEERKGIERKFVICNGFIVRDVPESERESKDMPRCHITHIVYLAVKSGEPMSLVQKALKDLMLEKLKITNVFAAAWYQVETTGGVVQTMDDGVMFDDKVLKGIRMSSRDRARIAKSQKRAQKVILPPLVQPSVVKASPLLALSSISTIHETGSSTMTAHAAGALGSTPNLLAGKISFGAQPKTSPPMDGRGRPSMAPPTRRRQGSADKNDRSEERRVGKECRSRWSPYH
eukprot:TRINITY_DN280_c0_g1_i2.p1 TRINITY_DN280_c0_g1~~TRINITY_DN280_c0_g1_i2.p1  ORF type:complete len:762 (+),score=205.77 TRINITY_DN280_c0_g1_i2:69-2354(+)